MDHYDTARQQQDLAAARLRGGLDRRSSGALNEDITEPVPGPNYRFGEPAKRKVARHKSAHGARPGPLATRKVNRVQMLGLGYNQEKLEPFTFVPQYNALSSASSFGKLEDHI